jgi:hypothetical protein
MEDPGWERSDAWLFVSVVIGGGSGRHLRSPTTRRPEGVPLAEVLATAEHLNQVIPEREELETAVQRLAGAGLITVTDGFFRVLPRGEKLWRTRPRTGISTAVDTILGALNKAQDPGSSSWSLTEQEYSAAVREYSVRYLAP